jgi:hypothetical protein
MMLDDPWIYLFFLMLVINAILSKDIIKLRRLLRKFQLETEEFAGKPAMQVPSYEEIYQRLVRNHGAVYNQDPEQILPKEY